MDTFKFDLNSNENVILLNPRWPKHDFESLTRLAQSAQENLNLQGHVWIATSGSTATSIGSTKLVAISKKALVASAQSVNKHLESDARDVWTQVLPSFHVGGLGIEVRAHLSGARVIPALKNEKWDVDHFYNVLIKEKCTLSALVPTQVFDSVEKNYEAPKTLRAIVVGGGVFESSLFSKARSLGWPVLPSYGMTETSSQIATATLGSLANGDYPEITLLSHAQARTSEDGFIEVQAESLFTCYAQYSDHGPSWWSPIQKGWFRTEDRGAVNEQHLLIQGRSKDYIKIGGEATNLARLRSILEKAISALSPSLSNSMVLIDVESARLGRKIHLVVSHRHDSIQTIIDLYNENVLPFERIRKTHTVSEIPRSDLGKVLWVQLRNKIAELK